MEQRDAPETVVILCGGKGLRMGGDAGGPPKALVPIGGMPILWHVMKIYSSFGYKHFVLTLGHRGDEIIAFFDRYRRRGGDSAPSPSAVDRGSHSPLPEDEQQWTVNFLHTGEHTLTGGRLKRAAAHIRGDHFLATYADGLANVDIPETVQRHFDKGLPATMLAPFTPLRFGIVEANNGVVTRFEEKPPRTVRINGGYFVFDRSIFERIHRDDDNLETDVLMPLASEGLLGCVEHDGFWQCADTPKDLIELQRIWNEGRPPWKIW